jgi:hypothetical protein
MTAARVAITRFAALRTTRDPSLFKKFEARGAMPRRVEGTLKYSHVSHSWYMTYQPKGAYGLASASALICCESRDRVDLEHRVAVQMWLQLR